MLYQQGCYQGLQLPPRLHHEIVEFATYQEAYGNRDKKLKFQFIEKAKAETKYGQQFAIGEFANIANRCPAVKQICQDPKLIEITAQYLKTEPIYSGCRLWWSFPKVAVQTQQLEFERLLYHYDPIDYGALKFFFYLTDVDYQSGPHHCVMGSHQQKGLRHQMTLFVGQSDKQILSYYDPEQIKVITGKAGYGFIEDPFCFHRGSRVKQRPRLMLQVLFRRNRYRGW